MPNLLVKRLSFETYACIGLIVFCLSLRVGVVALRYSELHDDPDAYIGIAKNLAFGRGFSIPGTSTPTAFRPPLYPLLIAPFSIAEFAAGRAGLNLLAAACGMFFIWRTTEYLKFTAVPKFVSLLAYGCDPLLLRYTSLSMTETVCSMFAAALLWSLVRLNGESSWRRALLVGVIFGCCALTRPTFWAFAMLYGGLFFLAWMTRRCKEYFAKPEQIAVVLAGTLLVVSPWLIRNMLVMKSPILMTTHGGYTVLLGNNEAFYREVVEQPFGTVWDGSHGPGQAVWANSINQRMDSLRLTSEVERDHWMSELAHQTIRENPGLFVKSCWLRFRRFWNLFPSGPAMENVSPTIYRLVGLWYGCVGIVFLFGCFCIISSRKMILANWIPTILLILAFTVVHLIYWSNVRMRAPIVPAIALIAGAGLHRLSIKGLRSQTETESVHLT